MAKLTPDIIDEIIDSFHRVGGADYLDELALRDPPTYCRLIAHVMPKEIMVAAQIAEPLDLGKAMASANERLALSRASRNDQN